MYRCLSIIAFGLLLAQPAAAEIYRYMDKQGNAVFTNQQPFGIEAERVELARPNLIQSPVLAGEVPVAEPQAAPPPELPDVMDAQQPYRMILLSGVPDILRVDQLKVRVELQPPLRENHRLRLLFNGRSLRPVGDGTHFQIIGIPRGVHSLQAVVFRDEGEVQRGEEYAFRRRQNELPGSAAIDDDVEQERRIEPAYGWSRALP